MTNYYLTITQIEPDFTSSAIIAASNAAQALDTMRQLAAPFGYQVQSNPRQLDRAEAAAMAAEAGAHIIKAKHPRRIRPTKPDKCNAQEAKREPMKQEQAAEIASALDRLDDNSKQRFLNFIAFLKVLDQQPRKAI